MNAKQMKAAALLANGAKCQAAAAAVGVTPQTLSNWKQDPAFEAAVNQFKAEAWDDLQRELEALRGRAVSTLGGLMAGGSESTRLRAACAVLQLSGDPDKWSFGIGPTDSDAVAKKRKRAEREAADADVATEMILSSLSGRRK